MLIECVPNVSEGRRADVIAELAAAIRAVNGVRLLHQTSDPSHNRSVFTLAGDRDAVVRAAGALVSAAIPRIDLRRHAGQHPRIGAVDVVPFVPLAGATMEDCVAVAREAGGRIGAQLGVPVFLYERAATRPERRALEAIRRGGFEGLAAKMATPGWAPDFGPRTPHPTAGAVAIGARPILIAYNVNLTTDRVDVARHIARAVRASGGGLPSVKALGLTITRGTHQVAQVSMNLTDYRQTSLADAFARVAAEAARHGVGVLESEIVGLVPADAFRGTTPEDLRLTGFTTSQILEERLNLQP